MDQGVMIAAAVLAAEKHRFDSELLLGNQGGNHPTPARYEDMMTIFKGFVSQLEKLSKFES
ncbi:MAG TPA: hypothetical protein VNH44_03130 [Micropepsaceae bacterium]|nr:hypothetical protein [Micropepsaceae bacterium]